MGDNLNKQNHVVYGLVRANLLAAVKGSYFIDNPNYIVHKVDKLYSLNHGIDHDEFLNCLIDQFQEMKKDFSFHIDEFQNVSRILGELEKYIRLKLNGEIE